MVFVNIHRWLRTAPLLLAMLAMRSEAVEAYFSIEMVEKSWNQFWA